MSQFPATGYWTIYSVQKTLPILGQVGSVLGTHNYLVMVEPDGTPFQELHGVYTDHFTVNGGNVGNYLEVQKWQPDEYMRDQTILSAKEVMYGSQTDIQTQFDKAFDSVEVDLNGTHDLYDGAELVGQSYNSNSVWYTAVQALGIARLGDDTSLAVVDGSEIKFIIVARQ